MAINKTKTYKTAKKITTQITTSTSSIPQTFAETIKDEPAKSIINQMISQKQHRYTEMLGVFVALFTFVSINIQVFNKIDTLGNALIFCFLIFLCLICFLIMMHIILSESFKSNGLFIFLIIFILLATAYGIYLIKNENIPLSYQEADEITKIKSRLDYIDGRLEKRAR